MYNKNFQLTPNDVKIVEDSLNKKIVVLLERRSTMIESTIQPPENIQSVKEYDAEIKVIRDLLGRIHQQKIWYRPKDQIYVSG